MHILYVYHKNVSALILRLTTKSLLLTRKGTRDKFLAICTITLFSIVQIILCLTLIIKTDLISTHFIIRSNMSKFNKNNITIFRQSTTNIKN